jgi:UDP-N-acetylglucosamine 2-epimerase (non-hydrolysing)
VADRILYVCGARPNFMKIAPLMRAADAADLTSLLVHTGQHYDDRMSKLFFDDLEIPRPRWNLEVGSGSHAWQTAEIMRRFEPLLAEQKPEIVVVVGDVNSTIACALVAAKLDVSVAHVEAGLRSFDRSMPEEINRLLTDAISDLLLVSEPSGLENLYNEGIKPQKVFFVGNVMIDTLMANRDKAQQSTILNDLHLSPGEYSVLTLHRPSNVDDAKTLSRLLDAFGKLQRDLPIIFPIHPRTRKNLAALGLEARLKAMPDLRLVEPMGYLDFLCLMSESACVLTDSGGMQEETTILGIPCLTLRENTERPITLTHGTNQIVGSDPTRILTAYRRIRGERIPAARQPEFWDGRAAERIIDIFQRYDPATRRTRKPEMSI